MLRSASPGAATRPSWLTDELALLLRRQRQWCLVGGDFPAELEPATPIPPARRQWSRHNSHRHNYAECLLALAGDCWYCLNNTYYRCQPRTAFYLSEGCQHDCFYPHEVRDIVHLWLRFLDDGVAVSCFTRTPASNGVAADSRIFLSNAQLGVVPAAFMVGDEQLDPETRRERKRILIAAVALKLTESPAPSETGGGDHQFQVQVVASIARHIQLTGGSGLDLASLAALAGYSKYHFLRLFERHTGSTVQQYIDDARWVFSQERRQTGCTQQQIALQLGFSSPSSFSRWRRIQAARRRDT